MKFHAALIKMNAALGYTDKTKGLCYGFTLRWLEAVFLGQEAQFMQRVQRIVQLVDENRIAERVASMRSKRGRDLTPNDETIIDLFAFFDSLELYHSANAHSDLFHTPVAFNQNYLEQTSPLAASDAIRALGGVKSIYSEIQTFNDDHFSQYLSDLGALLDALADDPSDTKSLGVLLFNSNHVIAIIYNGDSKWRFMDVNQDMFLVDIHEAILIRKVFDAETIASLTRTAYNCKFKKQAIRLSFITTPSNPHINALQETLIDYRRTHPNQEHHNIEDLPYLAAIDGNLSFMTALLEQHVDLNQPTTDGWTAAYGAAQYGYVDIILAIARGGGDLDKATPNGYTPAYIAAQNGHAAVINALAEKHADLDKATPNGYT
ncbi:MAG: ankyrin repeat domain-containing protein, partial [Methylocystaceae bacterium]|nr:ankyrin repeat domain-containing protein [Methylocystaceae bacterium]